MSRTTCFPYEDIQRSGLELRGIPSISSRLGRIAIGPVVVLLTVMAAAIHETAIAESGAEVPTYLDYKHALRTERWSGAVARCEEVIGQVHLFILWERAPARSEERVLEELGRRHGVEVLEVHEMHFPRPPDVVATCHLNFYTNNNCGVVPTYSAVFMSKKYLEEEKGVGPFKVVLYKFDCLDTKPEGRLNVWHGIHSDYLLTLKKFLRRKYTTARSKYTIHGTINRLESMVDIESLFGAGKYNVLADSAKKGKLWDGQVIVHAGEVCPPRRDRPCERVFESSYNLMNISRSPSVKPPRCENHRAHSCQNMHPSGQKFKT